jgi:hypothetical protein
MFVIPAACHGHKYIMLLYARGIGWLTDWFCVNATLDFASA